MSFDLAAWSVVHRARIDACLQARFEGAWPDGFREACSYPLSTGGKRIRPLLALAAAEAVNAESGLPALVAVASSVELVHSYSLVHDDLPDMDDDNERRGRPTVHVAFDVPTALLVGDALLTEAFRLLAGCGLPDDRVVGLVTELATAAGHLGMVGGQAADIGLGGPVTEIDQLERLHRGKTGALIRAAVRMGGIGAGATPAQLQALSRFGEAAGLAFQLADDLLDADEDSGDDGPPSFVKLQGAQATQARAAALTREALDAAAALPKPEALVALARYTIERDH